MKQWAFVLGDWGVVDRRVLYLVVKGPTSSAMVALLRVGRSGVVDDRHNRLVFGANLHSLSVSREGSAMKPWRQALQ